MSFKKYQQILKRISPVKLNGRVTQIIGLVIESSGPMASIGDICYITTRKKIVHTAEVVGFRKEKILLMPIKDTYGISPGDTVSTFHEPFSIQVGEALLGRILDGTGQPMDDLGDIRLAEERSVYASPPNPLHRRKISEVLPLGIRCIDGLITAGKGQRMGIFAGSGVGKSVLIGMMARNTEADINVIALIGERGREVREFIENDLGEEGLRRSVVVVATSDQSPISRVKGALVATTIAEYFRDQGKDVLFMMDSVTRYAMAMREIGLAAGEPPATKGYPPSVFASLPKLMERAGTARIGSITALYSVLVEGDDMDEPIADAARSILDGHIVLDRKLAARNHYPAIDPLPSISRVMNSIADPEHKVFAKKLLEMLAVHREAEDLINIGAYAPGSNPDIDHAIKYIQYINRWLKQDINENSSFQNSLNQLKAIFR